ncbi:hypothetical protein LU640_25480 [Pseudomonas monteilii]|uniref:hypothetical protein n=1 Tax=Pseudomonas monteilii TaxID=76759 RepID=UPI001E2FEF1F|nr:hypothetical protein [Pseudomonas monteilii]MCE1020500.1 hypothetical protein [Pseudomonas monteilii]MCE1037932.1 hypothetical protein [Pseudomonas monteilii]MCE1089977.1 hypothetical protein [Pseudomonas monteilii]
MNDIHDMTEAMKAEFLAAFRAQFGYGEMTATANDDAAAMLKAAAWAWRASREAVVVELPSEDTCRTSTSKEEAVQEAYNHALGECRAAIEAQGLKVAP